MHSPVNWALLGLIIERPSYGYALARRFERTYGHALPLSSVSHAYSALNALRERGLIEELPGTKSGPQPKPNYRATASGLEHYHEWLIGQVAEERRRQKVFLLQLTALTRDPVKAFEMLDAYEQACLAESCTPKIGRGEDGSPDDALELQARLIVEEMRLTIGAKIEWARFARSEIKELIKARAARGARKEPEP
jgi:DNA-binding PadR family transcriptional regulator